MAAKIQNFDFDSASSQEIKEYRREVLRVEQGNEKVRWAAFQEAQKREEVAALRFARKMAGYNKKTLPPTVEQFVLRLRKKVHQTMKKKGGTPLSVLRALFQFFDADNSGRLSYDELMRAMNKLGMPIDETLAKAVVEFYDKDKSGEFAYKDLMENMDGAAPHFLQHPESVTSRGINPPLTPILSVYKSYEIPTQDRRLGKVPSPLVKAFIKKIQDVLKVSMREKGGTENSTLKSLFLSHDTGLCGALTKEELRTAMKKIGLTLTEQEANAIVEFYDDKGDGRMSYQPLVSDCTKTMPHYMTHPETDRMQESARKFQERQVTTRSELETFRFTTRPAYKPRNKVVEKFKQRLRHHLEEYIKKEGGTIHGTIRNTFLFWDGDSSGALNPWEFKGAINRIGMAVSPEECQQVVEYYDFNNIGEMDYNRFVQDLSKEATKMLDYLDTKRIDAINSMTSAVRTPVDVNDINNKIAKAALKSAIKASTSSKGALGNMVPTEYLQGTFLRFDPTSSGKVRRADLDQVMQEIRASIKKAELDRLVAWYDRDATQCVYYPDLVKDCAPLMSISSNRSLPPVNLNHSIIQEKQSIEQQLRDIEIKEKEMAKKFGRGQMARSTGSLQRVTAPLNGSKSLEKLPNAVMRNSIR